MKNKFFQHLGWFAVLGVLSLTACQVVGDNDLLEQRASYVGTLTATLPQTRTVNDETNLHYVNWAEGDALSVLHTETGEAEFYESCFTYAGNNAFRGGLQSVATVNDWYILYPYSEDNTDPSQMKVTVLPDPVQTGNDSYSHLSGENFPLYGRKLGVNRDEGVLSIDVSHVLGYLRYKVQPGDEGDPVIVKRVEFTAPVAVSGGFVGDLTAEDATWTPEEGASKTVTLTVNDGAVIDAGEEGLFYAGVMPFTLEAGQSLYIKVTVVYPSAPETEVNLYETRSYSIDKVVNPGNYLPFTLSLKDMSTEAPTIPDDPSNPDDPQPEKADRNLAFPETSYAWTLGSDVVANQQYSISSLLGLTGDKIDDVTYSSTNTDVAAIVNNSLIVFKTTGLVTIKATAPETTTYKSDEATLQIQIVDGSTPPVVTTKTYNYVTTISAGTYIIGGYESGNDYSSDQTKLYIAQLPTVNENSSWKDHSGNDISGSLVPQLEYGTTYQVSEVVADPSTTEGQSIIASEVELISAGSNAWKLKFKDGTYLQAPTKNYEFNFANNESSASNFTVNSSSMTYSGYYFYHSGGAKAFTFRNDNSTVSNLRFYKLDTSSSTPVQQTQTIAFSPNTLNWELGDTYKIGESYDLPTLSDPKTAVTFTSSNPNVANVVDGMIKISGVGQTVITATAEATTSWTAATAKLTVTISNPAVQPTVTTYTKATSLTVGGTYLIVDVNDTRLFTAATNGSYETISPVNGVISDPNNSYAGYEFTVMQSGSKLCLMHDGKYLIDDYRGTSGNSTTGIVYESTKPADTYLYTCTVTNGVFFFSTKQRNGSDNDDEFLYYKPQSAGGTGADTFKLGGSGGNIGVHVYLKTSEGSSTPVDPTPDDPTPTTGSYYEKVTSEPSSWDGTYLFVDETSKKAFAAFSSGVSGYAVSVTINSDGTTITSNSTVDKYALTVSSLGTTHANASGQTAYNVKNTDGNYVYYSNSAIQITSTNEKEQSSYGLIRYSHAFMYDSSTNSKGVQVLSSGEYEGFNKYYLGYSSSAFGYSSSSSSRRVQLYKLKAGSSSDPGKTDQTFYFATSTVTKTLGTDVAQNGTIAIQSLTGTTYGSLSYSSDNTSVADIQNGQIVVKASGSANISATAAGDATHNPRTVSYKLVINPASSTTGSYYEKVTSEPSSWDGTYLFVDESSSMAFAAFSANSSSYAVNVTISNGKIAANSSVNKYALTVTDAGVNHGNSNASGRRAYNVKNSDGKYIYCSSSNVQINDSNTSTSSGSGSGWGSWGGGSSSTTYTYYHAFMYDNGVQVMSANTSSSGSAYYLGYGTNNNVTGFSYAGGSSPSTSNKARRVQLYKLNGEGGGSGSGDTPVDPTPTTGTTYAKATALSVGATYLVVDVSDTRLFTAATNGSYVNVSPTSGVIVDSNGSYASYEFTVTQSGSKLCLMHDGKYLIDDYSNSGNSTTGIVYESTKPADDYLYTCTVTNGVFFFTTKQRNGSNTDDEYLYYKPQSAGGTGADTFKLGGSGGNIGVHVYEKTSGGSSKQIQNPTFSSGSVNWTLGSGYTVGQTYDPQTLNNAHGTVTYSASPASVATISNNKIKIVAAGTATITATAAGDDNYYASSAVSYTLNILPESGVMVYNLENDCVSSYLTHALELYTASNHSSKTLINNGSTRYTDPDTGTNYMPGANYRYDCPKPVPISWSSVATGEKTVYIYNDSNRTDEELQVKSTGTSADVYNLIPGRTYYYTVKSGNTNLAEGVFMTSGRRRMMKISDNYNQNHANNCRDLGGQKTSDNKTIKYGKIYRGSNMDYTTTDEQEIIKNYMGVRLDVDLRVKNSSYSSTWSGSNNNGNNMCNALQFTDIPVGGSSYIGHTQEEYGSGGNNGGLTSTNMGYTLTRIMNAVHNGVNVYIHCMVGADRTGFTCMMLEAILGVPLERCDIDFELTSFSVVGARSRTGINDYYYGNGVSAVNNQSGSTYQQKAINLAKSLGVSQSTIDTFQADMLE